MVELKCKLGLDRKMAFGEQSLFPEVGGEIGLRNDVKCGLGKVAQGGSAAPG